MMDFADLYKPFYNRIQRYSVIDSMAVIYFYTRHLQFGQPLPRQIEIDPAIATAKGYKKKFFEWELDLLAREILQNAPMFSNFSLTRWSEFSTTINALKQLENSIYGHARNAPNHSVMLEVARIAHRQFPWQSRPKSGTLVRYFKIFNRPILDQIVRARVGLSTRELFTLGLSFTGHFLERFAYQYPGGVTVPELNQEMLISFVKHFAAPLSTIKKLAIETQQHNENYAYALNPLKMYPLVHVGIEGKHNLIAPIPTHLFHRFTSGIYYEIYDAEGFDGAFGNSFQEYIGEVLTATVPKAPFEVFSERQYCVGKDRKDTIDWIVRDEGCDLFVECKTKRLRFDSKITLTGSASLNDDIDKMANFVVQTYKTIIDAKAGYYPHWRPSDRRIYPIIVTLEDWYIFSPDIVSRIDKRVKEKLTSLSVDLEILDRHPYTIASCGDFEFLMRVIGLLDIRRVLGKKLNGDSRFWNVHAFLLDNFQGELRNTNDSLFPDDMTAIHPALER